MGWIYTAVIQFLHSISERQGRICYIDLDRDLICPTCDHFGWRNANTYIYIIPGDDVAPSRWPKSQYDEHPPIVIRGGAGYVFIVRKALWRVQLLHNSTPTFTILRACYKSAKINAKGIAKSKREKGRFFYALNTADANIPSLAKKGPSSRWSCSTGVVSKQPVDPRVPRGGSHLFYCLLVDPVAAVCANF